MKGQITKMKIFKYLAFGIVIVFLSIALYRNFIYYTIPFNPIKEYESESKFEFYITKNLPDGEGINTSCQDTEACGSVLAYLSNLNLKPLKDKAATELITYDSNTYFTGMMKLSETEKIFISDISVDTPNILHLNSSIPYFKSGYYQIEDSTFDYDYIYELIGNKNE